MKILAIDTTGQTASAALVTEDWVVAEYTLNYKLTHSQTIMPMISEICERSETPPESVDYIACACGPGSFTGLRIGAATAKGLALALGKKLVAVPTLYALAYNMVETKKVICPIMDARRNQVYAAFYRWQDGRLQAVSQQMAESIEEIQRIAEGFSEGVVFLGDGVKVHRETLQTNPSFSFAPAHCMLQRAASVGAAGLQMVQAGEAIEGDQLELIYLRKSQAEREREERLRAEEAVHD